MTDKPRTEPPAICDHRLEHFNDRWEYYDDRGFMTQSQINPPDAIKRICKICGAEQHKEWK